MDRMHVIEEWWRLNRGEWVSLEEILPFVVLHKRPGATDLAPTPMLIGAQSLQARVIGSSNPATFRQTLATSWTDYSTSVVAAHRRVTETGTPSIAENVFPKQLTGSGFAYRRGLFPVRTTTGQNMLMTYTTEVTTH